jgi:hypothetical protein
METAGAIKQKNNHVPVSKTRMLSIWARNLFASLALAKQQNATPLSLKETMETIRNLTEVERIILENRAELEAYLQGNKEMYVTVKDSWRRELSRLGSLWTSTMAAYSGIGSLGKTITESECAMGIHFNYTFHVPKRFRGIRNALLLAEFSDYVLNKKTNGSCGLDVIIIPDAKKVHLIEEFPAWGDNNINLYAPHPVFAIPCGKPLCSAWETQPPSAAIRLLRSPGDFIGVATVISENEIAISEPMSRNYCRMLVKSGDSSV